MKIFHPDNREVFKRDRRAYAFFELAYTSIDFAAAVLFIIGSVMFFYPDYLTPGTWCFLIGSIFFAMKPTMRISREIYYLAKGEDERVVRRSRK